MIQDIIGWKVEYEDGRTVVEGEVEKYTDIEFEKVKTLFFKFIRQSSQSLISGIAIPIPKGAKMFFRKRRHVRAMSGNVAKLQYIGGYRRLVGELRDTLVEIALIITVTGTTVTGIELTHDCAGIELIKEEMLDGEI